jgi:hypothetical protein
MNRATDVPTSAVPPEEVLRRIAEYRRSGFARQAPPQVVYPPAQHRCPWPDCDYRIAGINFRLEELGSTADRARWMAAWWQGPGLVGRCPGCGCYVLFGLQEKQAAPDPAPGEVGLLPDDWHRRARIVGPKPDG